MTRFYLTVASLAASAAGAAMILYGTLTGPRDRKGEEEQAVKLAFSNSAADSGSAILDLDIGHEGLKHREKEPFDPDKHKPERI
jgi:hypothetical protein